MTFSRYLSQVSKTLFRTFLVDFLGRLKDFEDCNVPPPLFFLCLLKIFFSRKQPKAERGRMQSERRSRNDTGGQSKSSNCWFGLFLFIHIHFKTLNDDYSIRNEKIVHRVFWGLQSVLRFTTLFLRVYWFLYGNWFV